MKLLLAAVLVAIVALPLPAAEELPALAEVGQNGYLSGQLIYPLEGRPTPQCHASTLVETPTGLVAAWFGGTHEKHADVGIWLSRREGEEWNRPVEVANGVQSEGKRHPCWNPVLFQPREGPLMLFYKVGPSPSTWWGMLMTSPDHGKTWSEPRKLGQSESLGQGNPNLIGPVKNKPIQLADGSILCPSSSEHDRWRVHFERTADLGQTWEVIGPIHDGREFGAIQPSLLRHGNDTLQIMCRSQQGVVATAWSSDLGRTWGKLTASELPNPNAGTDALTLTDGRHVIVYNHTGRGVGFPSGRNMLNVAISSDGRTWKPVLTLERDRGEFSYPAVIQTADGKLHITYTYQRQSIKHVAADPAAW